MGYNGSIILIMPLFINNFKVNHYICACTAWIESYVFQEKTTLRKGPTGLKALKKYMF